MEDKRSSGSGPFRMGSGVGSRQTRQALPTQQSRPVSPLPRLTWSPISRVAALSVCALFVAVAWSMTRQISASNAPTAIASAQQQGGENTGTLAPALPDTAAASGAAATSSAIADIGPTVVGTLAAQYAALQQKGAYTPEVGAAVAQQLVPSLKAPLSYKTFSIGDISTVNDTSYARMHQYQADLRVALAPLSQNTMPEISLFSAYVQTSDPKYLDELRVVAGEYQAAASAAAKVVVPQDAIAQHIAILNAMEQFSATLSALADNAEDPIAVMALLSTYNDAEASMVSSFDSIASYVTTHSKT